MATLRKRKHLHDWIYYLDFTYKGRRYIRSTKTSDPKIAKQILNDIQGQIARGTFNLDQYEKKHILLSSFLEEYFKYAESYKTKGTITLERYYLNKFQEYLGDKDLRAIDVRMLDQWRANFLNGKNEEKKLSPVTFNIVLRTLLAAFNLAKKWDYIEENPFENIEKVKVEERRLFLSDSEIEKLFHVIDEDIEKAEELNFKQSIKKMKNFYEFLLDTGLRRGEALNLKIEDVDLKENIIYVKKTKGKWERSVPLTLKARKIILDLGNNLFLGMNKDYTSERFRSYLRKANLNGFKLHSLRHTFGTRLHRAGVDIYTISKLLGHKDLKTSLIYAKTTTGSLQNAMTKLENLKQDVTLMQHERTKESDEVKKALKTLLPRQGSNLNSSDPESDVLPVTPRGSDYGYNVEKKSKLYNENFTESSLITIEIIGGSKK